MSTLKTTNIAHPSSASNNIVLDSSGGVDLDALTVSGSAPADSVNIDASGRLLVGTSTSRGNLFNTTGQDMRLQIEGTDYLTSGASFTSNSNSQSNCPHIAINRTRGTTIGSNTVVQDSDLLGIITFGGNDGSEFVEAARITAIVDATPGANDMPGRLVFSTTADGASSPTERMRIPQNGFTRFSNTGTYTSINASAHGFRTDASDWVIDNVNANASPYGLKVRYTAASPNNTGQQFFQCEDSTAIRAEIRSNGGLANFQANNVNLSDINSKKDISPAAGTWDCIKEWEIVNYRYKDQPDDADLNLGVIAQQVAESCPEVITVFEQAKDDQPEKLGVKEQQMYWMAIKALQEAMSRIETLEAEVAALKAQ